MGDKNHYQAVMKGRRSKAAGEYWENMIEAACEYYSQQGIAEIAKTPEPMRPIRSLGRGKFIAIFEKKAQPDYKGTLTGGGSIVFEAKHTYSDRMQQSVVTAEQKKRLNRHLKLGAECFVMVSFSFQRYFKVPWAIFCDMKVKYGRKYITPEDVREYEFKCIGGIPRFL